METITLYHIIKDGSYTEIEKVVLTRSAARVALKDYNGEYYRTFKKARNNAVKYLQNFIKQFKTAIERLNNTVEAQLVVIDYTKNQSL